jgi:hypothetical protein
MAKTALEQWSETAANNTDLDSIPTTAGGMYPSDARKFSQEIMSQVAAWLGDDTLASAATTDLGSVPGRYVNVTGTTTITGLGTIKAGTLKVVKFAGALTLTHNATSLILPGAANIVTAAGDIAILVSEGSGNWGCVNYQRAAIQPYILHLVHETATGVDGGSAVSGSGNIRSLTAKTNTIPGSSVGVDSFSLPAGSYDVTGWAAGYNVRQHQALIRNNTIADLALVGSSEYAASDSSTNSLISGRLVVASGGETFSLRHYIGAAMANQGLGIASDSGLTERYASLMIVKVSA